MRGCSFAKATAHEVCGCADVLMCRCADVQMREWVDG